jgi:hypothetical protein
VWQLRIPAQNSQKLKALKVIERLKTGLFLTLRAKSTVQTIRRKSFYSKNFKEAKS